MAKTLQQKKEELALLEETLDNKGVVFFNYANLTVHQFEELRSKLREEDTKVRVIKRKLLQLAFKNKKIEVADDAVSAQVAIATGSDEVLPAKVIADFKKDHKDIEFYGGLLESNFIDAAQVQQMSTLPTKQELLAKVVGSLNAPMSGFVNVMSGNLRGLVTALNAIKEQKES